MRIKKQFEYVKAAHILGELDLEIVLKSVKGVNSLTLESQTFGRTMRIKKQFEYVKAAHILGELGI
ncbi:hypothetical protein Glove_454g20 [Diversispora epigaea]|uniref:Uncharacterized protein n=1 Tax=Diversispora epigaea TaxID=1348612 RepID=A0A397GV69_9GLOM|nr:hypothetical protein Glove_454g20 [Diversispora epigaea]